MATSGTYSFNPGIGSMALAAFARCQVRRPEITQQHMQDVYNETNLMQAAWAADGITWFTVELVTETMVEGQATYTVPLEVVSVLDVYVSPDSGTSGQNRLIMPFSRTDYASLANPAQQGFPTSFWWNRVIPATLNFWPVPDNATTYLLSYYVYKQIEDAELRQGGNAQVPYFWLDAYVADLAYRMSRIYAPALEEKREKDRDKAYLTANKQVENSAIYIQPGLDGYFRS